MDGSPPGSFVRGDSPGKNTGVGFHALLQEIFPTQGSNPGLPHCRQILYIWATKKAPIQYLHLNQLHLQRPYFHLVSHSKFSGGHGFAAAKSLQSCPTLRNPIDGSPPGSPIPGILQARTLEWVAISFSNACKWKWSRSVVSDSSRPHGLQPTRLLHPWDFPGKSTGVGCHCLLWRTWIWGNTIQPSIVPLKLIDKFILI